MGWLIILKPICHACYCFWFVKSIDLGFWKGKIFGSRYIILVVFDYNVIFCFCSHYNILSLIVGMSGELPKRLIKEGEETQVTQINNNCRMVCYMERLEEWLPKELKEVKKDPVFAPIFKLYENGLGYSARVIHSFLCRDLVTYQNYELWFAFARRALRFSLVEYHAVTGLQCDTSLWRKELVEFEDDGGFWSTVVRRKEGVTILDLWKNHHEAVKKWSNADRIKFSADFGTFHLTNFHFYS